MNAILVEAMKLLMEFTDWQTGTRNLRDEGNPWKPEIIQTFLFICSKKLDRFTKMENNLEL